jgi:outer membrane receptor for ferrienterochelin and colicins
MKINILTLILIVFSPIFLFSQENKVDNEFIRGRVIELVSGGKQDGLPGVIIKSKKSKTLARTSVDGYFEISIQYFPDTLIVENLGFNKAIIFVDEPLTNLIIELKAGNQLDVVTITGKNDGKSIDLLSPFHIEQIGEGELRKAACCNLSESFETNASVDVSLTDAVSGAKKIQMLGLDGIYTQLQWENIPLVRGLSSSYGLNFTPGTWIESIQITKGTGSVVNGYESMAGLINLTLKNPSSKEAFYINTYGNSMGRGEVNIHGAQNLKNNWKTMSFLHVSNNFIEVDRNKDKFIDVPVGPSASFFNRWEKTGKNYETRFGLKATFADKKGGQLSSVGDDVTSRYGVGLYTNHLELFAKAGFFMKKRKFGSVGLVSQGKYHYLKNTFGNTVYEGTQKKYYFNGIYSDIIGNTNHNYKTGLSFILDDYNQTFLDSNFLKTEIVPGAFFEYTYSHAKKFILVAGLRGDYHNIHGLLYAPRLHAKWNINPKNALRFSVGRGLRVPNPYSDYTSLMASSRVWIVDPEIKPEDAINAGITYTQKFQIHDNVSSFSVDYFYTDFFNQLVVDQDINPNEIHLYNSNGKSYSHSFQAELSVSPSKTLELRSAFKYYDVKAKFDGVLQQKAFVPKFRALFNLGYMTRNKKWSYDITANWIGQKRLPSTSTNPIEHQRPLESNEYWLLNSQITYKRKRFSVYLGAENILNVMQKNAIISPDDPFGSYFDATQIWSPISGVNIYAGMHFTIKQKKK